MPQRYLKKELISSLLLSLNFYTINKLVPNRWWASPPAFGGRRRSSPVANQIIYNTIL